MSFLNALKNRLSDTVRQVQHAVQNTEAVVAKRTAKVEHVVADGFDDAKRGAGALLNQAAKGAMNTAVAATAVTRDLAAHGVDRLQAASNAAVDSAQRSVTGAVDAAQKWANAAVNSGQHVAGGVVDTAQ